jgi:hypothetical protein
MAQLPPVDTVWTPCGLAFPIVVAESLERALTSVAVRRAAAWICVEQQIKTRLANNGNACRKRGMPDRIMMLQPNVAPRHTSTHSDARI